MHYTCLQLVHAQIFFIIIIDIFNLIDEINITVNEKWCIDL